MTTANLFYYKAGLVPPHYNFPTLSLQEPTVIAMCNNKFKPLGLKWFKFPGSFRLRFFLLFFWREEGAPQSQLKQFSYIKDWGYGKNVFVT